MYSSYGRLDYHLGEHRTGGNNVQVPGQQRTTIREKLATPAGHSPTSDHSIPQPSNLRLVTALLRRLIRPSRLGKAISLAANQGTIIPRPPKSAVSRSKTSTETLILGTADSSARHCAIDRRLPELAVVRQTRAWRIAHEPNGLFLRAEVRTNLFPDQQ